MVGYYQSEAELPWAGKCICEHVFVVSSAPHSASFLFLFQAPHHGPGLLLGETRDECKAGFIRRRQAVLSGADVVQLLKIYIYACV